MGWLCRSHTHIVGRRWSAPETFDQPYLRRVFADLACSRIRLARATHVSRESSLSILCVEPSLGPDQWRLERTGGVGALCSPEERRQSVDCCAADCPVSSRRDSL